MGGQGGQRHWEIDVEGDRETFTCRGRLTEMQAGLAESQIQNQGQRRGQSERLPCPVPKSRSFQTQRSWERPQPPML